MRKAILAIVIALATVFSLSAEEILKERYVKGNIVEGPAKVCLISEEDDLKEFGIFTRYYVVWFERDGSDIVNVYDCDSIEQAFNVWLMSRNEIESKRQISVELVEELYGTLCLIRAYELK